VRILIAPDKFKGSLTALEAAQAIRAGLAVVFPDATFDLAPLADGGEGTLEALFQAGGGTLEPLRVPGPLGREVEACWLLRPDGTAVIEAARALSLTLVPPDPLSPGGASSAGLGHLLRAVAERGCSRILVGVGGTATMDGGAGALVALGARLLDDGGRELPPGGQALQRLAEARLEGLEPYRRLEIRALCDVDNPLIGPAGAAVVYGPQKGADAAMVRELELGLSRWREVLGRTVADAGVDHAGDGAAGGLGFGLRVGMGAGLEPGGPYLMRETGVEARLAAAELVVTGEGSIDVQSLRGKVVGTLAAAAARAGVPLVAIGGQVRSPGEGPAFPFPTLSTYEAPMPLEQAVAEAKRSLERSARQLGELLKLGGRLGASGGGARTSPGTDDGLKPGGRPGAR
jgi:glycerate kinase